MDKNALNEYKRLRLVNNPYVRVWECTRCKKEELVLAPITAQPMFVPRYLFDELEKQGVIEKCRKEEDAVKSKVENAQKNFLCGDCEKKGIKDETA